ncbi:unnamed protein product [Prorocentrum cordatum]|uniref:Uncharacterized protein n=1 Tax=Prorocentrum cordatum TaxID=2364126 RepID=A0ABN9V6S3_9DINO|nr:unnamed protein product [Polarella glacialis]
MRTRKEGGRGEGGHQEVPMPPRPQRPGPLFGCALARLPRRISRGGDEVLPGGPSRRQRAKGIAAGGGGGERREAALPPPCMGRHVAGAGTTPRLGELPPSGRRGAAASRAHVGAAGGAPRGRRSPPPGTLAGARGRSGAARASLQTRVLVCWGDAELT